MSVTDAVDFMSQDHRRCDELWAAVETAADASDLDATRQAFAAFDGAVRHHIDFEDSVVFPTLEDAMGMHGGGPTHVMRTEHEQMRRILSTMQGALEAGNTGAVLDHGDSLLMLIQQHNSKEENVLYPMIDNSLGDDWAKLQERF